MKDILSLLIFSLITNFIIAQNTILWSINKVNSEKVAYIIGTFHQMGNSFIDEKPLIKELLSKCELAIFESVEDKNEKIITVMLNRTDDFSYKEFLYKEDIDFLENYTKNWKVPLSKHKPGELIVKLQQEYIKESCGTIKPTDTSYHMDDYLMSIAEKQNIKVLGLETYSNQFDAINIVNGEELTWEKTKNIIRQVINNFKDDKNQKKICASAKAYMEMKFNYQFKVKCADSDGILSKRNEKWIPTIINSIEQNNSVFIAVGMLHLYGECGIISQLKKNGYEVKTLKLK